MNLFSHPDLVLQKTLKKHLCRLLLLCVIDYSYDSFQPLPGYQADLCLWNIKHPVERSYQLCTYPLKQRILAGQSFRKIPG